MFRIAKSQARSDTSVSSTATTILLSVSAAACTNLDAACLILLPDRIPASPRKALFGAMLTHRVRAAIRATCPSIALVPGTSGWWLILLSRFHPPNVSHQCVIHPIGSCWMKTPDSGSRHPNRWKDLVGNKVECDRCNQT